MKDEWMELYCNFIGKEQKHVFGNKEFGLTSVDLLNLYNWYSDSQDCVREQVLHVMVQGIYKQ